MTPEIVNLEMARGDTFSFDLNLPDIAEESVTSIFFSAKKNKNTDSEYLFSKSLGDGIELIDEKTFRVRVAPRDTADAIPGKYDYDLQLGIGEDIFTPMAGKLKIIGDVTEMQYGS